MLLRRQYVREVIDSGEPQDDFPWFQEPLASSMVRVSPFSHGRSMVASSTHAQAHSVHAALVVLQRGERRMVGELQRPEHEISLIRAIRGEEITSIGPYQVYTDTSRENRTTVFVHDPSGDVEHKYILASTESRSFVVATPMSWTVLHKNILARIMAATGEAAHCSGGGFVRIGENGKLEVDGASTDYGAADHVTAKAALTVAVKNSVATSASRHEG